MKQKFALFALALIGIAGIASTATAGQFWIVWPVKCTVDVDCYVQNYVDHDPSTSAADYACNSLTSDGHLGTDIRLLSMDAMRKGVDVLAPAAGTVIGVRDDAEDKSVTDDTGNSVALPPDKQCGNGINMRNSNAWRTQLCHLKHGSITVKAGDRVKAGQVIGQVGMSGDTDFPHVELQVWNGMTLMDPFINDKASVPCDSRAGLSDRNGMWATRQHYHPVTLVGSGFLTEVPDMKKMRDKPESTLKIPMSAPAITFWGDLIGIKFGDVVQLSITGPDGHPIAQNEEKVTKTLPQFFVYIGKRNSIPLLPGSYMAKITVIRIGSSLPILQSSRTVEVIRDQPAAVPGATNLKVPPPQ